MDTLRPLEPSLTVELIREIDDALEQLLAGLGVDDWRRPAVKDWRVRDVAAHLLDTNLRRLSLDRDHHQPEGLEPPGDPESFEAWVEFINRLNADWIRASGRLSPAVLLDLLRLTNGQVREYFQGLDADAPAAFEVPWAAESGARAWLDVAREYTEKWHHQQQIREAVGKAALGSPHLLRPLLETLLRAVPPAYEAVETEAGASILISATDLEGGTWLMRRDTSGWRLHHCPEGAPADATIRLGSETLWKLLMKQVSREEARSRSAVSGPPDLVSPFFEAVAVMA